MARDCNDPTKPFQETHIVFRPSSCQIRTPLKTPALEATWKTNVDLSPFSRTCDTESSFRAMSVSLHNLVWPLHNWIAALWNKELSDRLLQRLLPWDFLTKGAFKYIGDAFLFVTKPHPEPFLGESGVCESRGKTEDENNLEGKGNCLWRAVWIMSLVNDQASTD